MNSVRNAERILSRIIVTIGIWCISAHSQSTLGAQSKTTIPPGRDNPFARIARPKALQTPASTLPGSEFGGAMPELFIATVKLKSLDAQTLSAAIVGMSSPYGSISADVKNNALVICDTKEMLAKIQEEVNRADGTPQEMMFVETVGLKFLEAETLVTVLEGMSSPYGSIIANKNTNSLVIRDTKESLNRILAEIEKADRTPKQIMVEVVIVDVQLNDDTEIGINWDLLSDKNYDISYKQNFTNRLGTIPATDDNRAAGTAFNTTGVGGDFSVISGTVRHVVTLLQTKRDVEILASPRAMMVSGQSASIKAVEEIPFLEVSDTAAGGAGALTSTEFKEVGITLDVTATVTDGNNIFLTLDTEQSVKTGESATGVPVVDTRKANTSLMLLDGQLVVIGGLRRQEKTKQVYQIPILGDLPLIGFMFRSTNTVTNNTELVVFISPHIYGEAEPIPEDSMLKYREITERPMLSLPADKSKDDSDKGPHERDVELKEEEDLEVTVELSSDPTEPEAILNYQTREAASSSEASPGKERRLARRREQWYVPIKWSF